MSVDPVANNLQLYFQITPNRYFPKNSDFKQLFIAYLILQKNCFLELHSVVAFLTKIKSYDGDFDKENIVYCVKKNTLLNVNITQEDKQLNKDVTNKVNTIN